MEFYLPIILFTISTSITPGPNNIILLNSGLNYGIIKTIPCYLGICLGFCFMVFIIGLGLGELFLQFPTFHQIIQIVGVCYLLFLALKIALIRKQTNKKVTKPLNFYQAVLFQWVNPKAWTMATGIISSYTNINDNIIQQVMIIVLIYLISVLPCTGLWLFCGSFLQKIITKPTHLKVFNISIATLLVISVLPIINSYLRLF